MARSDFVHMRPGLLVLSAVATCVAQSLPALPQGNTGIAARYPGDAGIAADSAVIFADDFESYADGSGLNTRWNGGVYHYVNIATDSAKVFAGRKSLEFRSPQQTAELSNTVARDLGPGEEVDVLFLRYYTKFDESFDIAGSSHNGGGMSAHYFVNGQATPGVPANGTNKFLAEFECWRGDFTAASPGDFNVYIYHPEQRSQWGDHWYPDGTIMPNTSLPGNFGSDFVARPIIACQLDRWYCCEMMIKANTPGSRDGRLACWLDGVLIADFTNLRLRDVDSLTINRFNLSLHSGTNTRAETWKWYDNVVAAKSYIGPMMPPSTARRVLDSRILPCVGVCISQAAIVLEMSRPARVVADLLSPQGRIAGILIDGTLSAGRHRFPWSDRIGQVGAEGMSLIRIRTGDEFRLVKVPAAR